MRYSVRRSRPWRICRAEPSHILNWKGKEFCPNEKRSILDFLERKADHAFQEELAAQTTTENGECEMVILLFMKLACSSNPRGWNDMLDAIIASASKKLLDRHVHFRKRESVEEQGERQPILTRETNCLHGL